MFGWMNVVAYGNTESYVGERRSIAQPNIMSSFSG